MNRFAFYIRLNYALILFLSIGIGFAILSSASAHASSASETKDSFVYLSSGWEYAASEATPDKAEQTIWYPLKELNDAPVDVETGRRTIYSFKIELPAVNCKECVFSIPHYSRSFDLYLGNERIFRMSGGTENNTISAERTPLFITIPADPMDRTMIMVSNQYHRSFPPSHPVYYGEKSAIIQAYWQEERIYLIIGMLNLLIGLISLLLYFSLTKDKAFIFLSLVAFHLGLFLWSNSGIIVFFTGMPTFWFYAEYLLIYLFPLNIWLYFQNRIPSGRTLNRLIVGIHCAFVSMVVITAWYGDPVFNWYNEQLFLFILTLVIITVQLIRSIRSGNEGAKLLAYSFMVIFVVVISSLLLNAYFIDPIDLNPYIGAIFIISQLLLMTYRFRRINEELRLYSENLQKINTMLNEMNTFKDSIIANTSHELRTPLNGIIGLAESMIGLPKQIEFDYDTNLGAISESGRRLQRIVNQMIDLADMRKGNLNLDIQPIPLYSFIEQLKEPFTRALRGKTISILNQIEPSLTVYADPYRMQQVFYQLLDNAVKFTQEGFIRFTAHTDDDGIRIAVSDSGIGIHADQMNTIFEMFVQGDASAERAYGGTGIGLTIAKLITEAHQGTIICSSTPGEGSTFTVRLPIPADQIKNRQISRAG